MKMYRRVKLSSAILVIGTGWRGVVSFTALLRCTYCSALPLATGRAIAEAVSHWLPTAAGLVMWD
jgi:hypothetical protein